MIVGWDIGAVNIKAAGLNKEETGRAQIRVASQAFEIWRNKEALPDVLRMVLSSVCDENNPRAMAVTMTAELSDAFLTKREGVLYVLNSLGKAFPGVKTYVFSLDGIFVSPDAARLHPLDFAASNWMATATWVAARIPNCLVLDTGSTTTDILPILDGRVATSGRNDLERLSTGELVYTGALRTNLAAIAQAVPVSGRFCPVASEYFSISGDIHLILGNLRAYEYSCPTPDGQPASVDSARRRVARLVCADTEMLNAVQIDEIARYLADRQIRQIQGSMAQVAERLPSIKNHPAIILGSGAFLAEAAARMAGFEIGTIMDNLGQRESAVAPSLAVAQLLDRDLR
jgi:probable H4MPT-linked C1 transfer pathway protein